MVIYFKIIPITKLDSNNQKSPDRISYKNKSPMKYYFISKLNSNSFIYLLVKYSIDWDWYIIFEFILLAKYKI